MRPDIRLEAVDFRTYERVLASSAASGTPFHRAEWLIGTAQGLGYECTIFRVADQEGEVALIPWLNGRRGPFSVWGSPIPGSLTPYIGPLPLRPLSRNAKVALTLHAADSLMTSHRVSSMSLAFPGAMAAPEAEPDPRWKMSCPETYLLDVQADEETLWRGMKSRSRGAVRKAEASGVEVRPAEDPGIVALFYAMLVRTFGRHGSVPPHPRGLYQSLWAHLVPAGMLRTLVAWHEGKAVSIGLFVHDDREVHFLSGASDPEALGIGAANAVQWELIRWAAAKGLATYDLGGRGVSGIDKFKESFGPRVASYTRFERSTFSARVARRILEWSYRSSWRRRLSPGRAK